MDIFARSSVESEELLSVPPTPAKNQNQPYSALKSNQWTWPKTSPRLPTLKTVVLFFRLGLKKKPFAWTIDKLSKVNINHDGVNSQLITWVSSAPSKSSLDADSSNCSLNDILKYLKNNYDDFILPVQPASVRFEVGEHYLAHCVHIFIPHLDHLHEYLGEN